MVDSLADALGASSSVAVLVIILAIVQVIAQVAAVVDLARRPANPAIRGAKWIWLAIILLANLAGAVIWFAVGRAAIAPPLTVAEPIPSTTGPRRTPAEVVELLYGPSHTAEGQ